MKKFCVIGNPVNHSLSPAIFKCIFQDFKIHAEYKKIHLEHHSLLRDFFLKTKNIYNGYNITAPFKDNILDIVDEVDSSAQLLQSINCVKNLNNKLIGYNTDCYGFELLLKNSLKIDFKNKNFLILGNGSTARNVVFVLNNLYAKNINILGRNSKNVYNFIDNMNNNIIGLNKVVEYEKNHDNYILINCLPINVSQDSTNMMLKNIIMKNIELLIDVNYTNNFVSDKFISKKINTIMGHNMLLYQAIKNFDIWFDQDISNNFDITKIKKQVFKNV